ncbi:asparagine synthase-related protein [Aquimarina muelleri]|nr:asparagine synthase-related protein [Aquimarina muelleri]MCX2762060.1 asparagine synthase-related protein [Aquimarina muelleri]
MNHFIISKSNLQPFGQSEVKLTEQWNLTIQGKKYHDYNDTGTRIIVIGDYIGKKEDLFTTETNDIPKLRGNFYAIIIKNEKIKIYSSFLNILPIYHTVDNTYISSSVELIRKNSKANFSIDKKFILEILLFNYGFFNRTLYQDIQLVPCNYFLELQLEVVTMHKHFETASLFTQTSLKKQKKVNDLSTLFIKTTKFYFPETPFDIAFTSGFDGRTLVSCATYHNKDFKTFSFGKSNNDDVTIPKKNAEDLNIKYQYFDLGKKTYIDQDYYTNAKEYIKQYPGANGFIYSHFLYSTKKIATDTNYLLSGVIGSELFRALHITGAVTSKSLADIFISNTPQEIRNKISSSPAIKHLKKEEFETDLEELIQELITYKDSISKNLTKNQQFYTFVFEEVFRKFFGQWISMQMNHINVRTPFLDFKFITELLKTKYAGANNDFFTENPLKRMKGQYLYTDIIKKTNSKIYHQKTGKGYRPKDLRESIYIYKIIIPFLLKRFKRKTKTPNLDNLSIISGVLANKHHIKKCLEDVEYTYFDFSSINKMLDNLSPYTPEKERDSLLMMISVILAIKNNSLTNSKK